MIDENDDWFRENPHLKRLPWEKPYKFGDWVVYDQGYKQQIGRVTECGDKSAFVCYSTGCTAASTPLEYLRRATDSEIAAADKSIGFNRFNETCPSRNEECCYMCKAEKGAE